MKTVIGQFRLLKVNSSMRRRLIFFVGIYFLGVDLANKSFENQKNFFVDYTPLLYQHHPIPINGQYLRK